MVTVNLSAAAIEALSVILDINDDDDVMTEAGAPAEGLAALREAVAAAAESRAYRAAAYFTEARAAHDDIAGGTYPTL